MSKWCEGPCSQCKPRRHRRGDIELRPRHVIVLEEDMYEILDSLEMNLSSRRRPRLKPAHPIRAIPTAMDTSMFANISGTNSNARSLCSSSIPASAETAFSLKSMHRPHGSSSRKIGDMIIKTKWTFVHVVLEGDDCKIPMSARSV